MSKYFGKDPPATVGRSRLLRGTDPVNEPVEPAENPAQTASPVEPFNAPERKKWARKRGKGQASRDLDHPAEPLADAPLSTGKSAQKLTGPPPATRALREGGNKRWDGEHVCDACGGFVNITPAGASGQDAKCGGCGREWILRRGCGGWQRG